MQFLLDILWYLKNLRHEPHYYAVLRANLAPIVKLFDIQPSDSDNNKQAHTAKTSATQSSVIRQSSSYIDVRRELITILAHMRFVRPEDVDEFMLMQGLSPDFINSVHTAAADEHIGGDIIWSSSTSGIANVLVNMLEVPLLQQQYISVLEYITVAENFSAWVLFAIRGVIKGIYGSKSLNLDAQ